MAFLENKYCKIVGMAACLPKNIEDNSQLSLLGDAEDIKKFLDLTGIYKRHTVKNTGICTSDLCFTAASQLISDLGWQPEEIECLIFVSQTPDYILPATSCLLQSRLKLSQDCFTLDLSLGCSGWVYGLSTISSLINSGKFKKALLLVGDTVTVTKSPFDKSTFPLFGDAGTATAIEYDESEVPMRFHLGSDGNGYKSILIKDGGFRNFYSESSLVIEKKEDGITRNDLHSTLDGTNVFIFGITAAPKSIKCLISKYNIDFSQVDYVVLHQANKMMTEKIRKKIGVSADKVPYSIGEFGNTSSASIPLTIISQLKDVVTNERKSFVVCGFGVGLSWGTGYFELDNIVCSDLLYI